MTKSQQQIDFLVNMIRGRLQKVKAAGVSLPANFPALARQGAIELAARYSAQGVAEEVAILAEEIARKIMCRPDEAR